MQTIEDLKSILIQKNSELNASQLEVFKCEPHNSIEHLNIAIEQMAHSNIGAFIILNENENYLASMAMIRMHLDCLLKLFSIFIIEQREEWIKLLLYTEEECWKKKIIINGKRFSLNDRFLCSQLEQQGSFKGATELYKYSCDFIHPSDKHFKTTIKELKQDENGRTKWSTRINIFGKSEINEDIIKSNYVCMIRITDSIIDYIKQTKLKDLNYTKYKLVL
jgi:hypothetical protein